jgi:CxxC motif-containing protein (DUF1111 family)
VSERLARTTENNLHKIKENKIMKTLSPKKPTTSLAIAGIGLLGLLFATTSLVPTASGQNVSEAPAGFDNQSNGYVNQAQHDKDRKEFEEQATIEEGLGPVYTARSCAACHGQPASGGGSQVLHVIAGHQDSSGNFVGATAELGDGSALPLIQQSGFLSPRSICSDAQLRLPETGQSEPIRSSRIALSGLGDGFVEAIPDLTLVAIAAGQPAQSDGHIAGEFAIAPVFDSGQITFAVGRLGWKSGVSSLLTFAALAYLGDLGITNRLFPNELVSECDTVPDPEDDQGPPGHQGIDALASFLRATKVPPRDAVLAATADAQAGSVHFNQIGCAICHVSTLQTAPVGTVINGGTLTIPRALGDKLIHPYTDFLLHDVGTGDGTVNFGAPQSTANKLRTTPLWGVRMRNRLMHDGESRTFTEAILRHQGEATDVVSHFNNLSDTEKAQLIKFLKSL